MGRVLVRSDVLFDIGPEDSSVFVDLCFGVLGCRVVFLGMVFGEMNENEGELVWNDFLDENVFVGESGRSIHLSSP